MNTRRISVALLFALVSSGLLTWMLSEHLPHVSPSPRAIPSPQTVVAAKDIQVGDTLTGDSMSVVAIQGSQALKGAFQTPRDITGRVVQVSINSGEPILSHDLAQEDEGSGLAVAIPPGMRAVSFRTADGAAAGGGFTVPGSYVDILVTYKPASAEAFVTSAVLQDVRVLAVGQSRDTRLEGRLRPDDDITVLVTPEAASRLTTAMSIGRVNLVLRNGRDRALIAGPSGLQVSSKNGSETATRAQSARIRPAVVPNSSSAADYKIEILSGGKSTIQTFRGESQ